MKEPQVVVSSSVDATPHLGAMVFNQLTAKEQAAMLALMYANLYDADVQCKNIREAFTFKGQAAKFIRELTEPKKDGRSLFAMEVQKRANPVHDSTKYTLTAHRYVETANGVKHQGDRLVGSQIISSQELLHSKPHGSGIVVEYLETLAMRMGVQLLHDTLKETKQ